MKDSLHTLLYATVLGLICATALTSVDRFTAERKQANAKAEEIRNILSVLGVRTHSGASSAELIEVFEENVHLEKRGELVTYTYRPSGPDSNVQTVAVAFGGAGLWGPIEGFLALDANMETIVAITFYKHEETPGLGGQIGSQAFRSQFEGKSIIGADGSPGIRIVRGTSTADNEVDAITGATMTCTKVQTMLNATIRRIVQERDKHAR